MPSCAAANCTNNPRKGYRLYTFPKDVKRRQLWAKICGRINWEPTVHSKLCEVHFEENQFSVRECDGRRFLKPNSIPTLFTNPQITENGQIQMETIQEETPESFLNYDSSTSSKDLTTIKQKKIHKLQKTVKSLRQKVKQISAKLQSLERSLNILQQDQVGGTALPLKTLNLTDMIGFENNHRDQFRQQWNSSYIANSSRFGMMPCLGDFSPFKQTEILNVNGAYNIQYQLQNDSMDASSIEHSELSKFPSSDEEYSNEIDEYDLQQAKINLQEGMQDTTCLFMCEVCYQTYPDSNSLEKHHDLHTVDGISDHEVSGENSTKRESTLSDLQDFICKFCNRKFNNDVSLSNHLKIHNRKTSLACDSCGKQFKTTAGLNKHKKTHSLEKPHMCTMCTMRFKRMYHLKRHLKTHYKNKACDKCTLKFKTERDLKMHKKKHNGVVNSAANNAAVTTTHACIIRLKKDQK
ncbi:zinc finger protein 253-like isoform X1 [Centruroides vittatus]|uniref:zinc finger protein 253-like isoform X1 n=1 Tax=Centruroides vittatus TaxID=120091 RepID=UPI00351083C3